MVGCVEDEIDYKWRRVAGELARRILAQQQGYTFGAMIRIRGGITEEFDVSEGVARHAIQELARPDREGGPLVRKLPGSGTYVSWKPGKPGE